MKNALAILLFILPHSLMLASAGSSEELTDDQIRQIISQHRPMKGATIPSDIKDRLGATHVGGKYYLTNEPFIIEGSRKLAEMGYGVLKLWFTKNPTGYTWNSNWNLKENITLKELAQHPYYKASFDMPFSTIALMVGGAAIRTTDESAAAEEEEIYELTKYLLETYRHRDLTFIIHNWEGDWLMRGGTGNYARWSRQAGQPIGAVDGDRVTVLVPADSLDRAETMTKWFAARQRGVERARTEVTDTKCKVYHAIEANRVMDSMDGIPGIANFVLPNVEVDMVSWSCYDGLDPEGLKLYRGIEYLKQQMRPTKYMNGQRVVFLGEIGIPEQRFEGLREKEPVQERWDIFMGVSFALDVPYIMHWELYCNEPKNEAHRSLTDRPRTKEEMRGFWLLRPDGTKGFAAEYFDRLLDNAGRKIDF